MKPSPFLITGRMLLVTVTLIIVSLAVHAQVSERSSWAVGVCGVADAGLIHGRIGIPLALGTAPGTTYQDIGITGGVTYAVGMQILAAFRPPSSFTSFAVSIGMQRRHIAASGNVGEPLLTTQDGGQADLLQDQTLMMAGVDGRYSIGRGWHVLGSLGIEVPLGREQAALWIYETGALRIEDPRQPSSGVRYRSMVDVRERYTISAGLARDVIVGMHGNTGVVLTPQLTVVTGSSLTDGTTWIPIVIRMGVTLTLAL